MNEADPKLSVEAFRAALAKGLGRTLQLLRRTDPAPYREAILNACLTVERHSLWMEPDPAHYLMEHVRLAGMESEVLEAVLLRFDEDAPRHIRYHLAGILEEYAREGEERAWQTLCNHALNGDEASRSALESLGTRGVEWLVAHVLPTLQEEDLYHVYGWIRALPEGDESETARTLRRIESRLEAQWDVARQARAAEPPFNVEAFLSLPEAERTTKMAYAFLRTATESQLATLAKQFVKTEEEASLKGYFRVFNRRAFPLDPALLVARADEEKCGWAFRAAMSNVDSPLVRDYALRLLETRPLPWHAVWALEHSFRAGDEPTLMEALRSVEGADDETLHHHVKCLWSLLEAAAEIDWASFYDWLYEHSPCVSCRATLVRSAIEDDVLPERLREELRDDVDPDIRAKIAEIYTE